MNNTDDTKSEAFIFKIANIISKNEGYYGSINQYDGSASSIGILQWNGFRAKGLLELIIGKDEKQAKIILNGTKILDDINREGKFWDNRILDSCECEEVRKLLSTENGIEAQNELLKSDISSYIDHGKKLGITDKKALVYFCDLENQFGYYEAEKIIKSIDQNKELTIHNILTASVLYSSFTVHTRRRTFTYNEILNDTF